MCDKKRQLHRAKRAMGSDPIADTIADRYTVGAMIDLDDMPAR